MVLTTWQSLDNLAVRIPTLFCGLSNHGIGIFRILLNVYYLIFFVMHSPTRLNEAVCSVVNINDIIPKIRNINAYNSIFFNS